MYVSSQTVPVISHPMDTSESLVELLQQSAVEHLTKFRQLEAQEFCSFGRIVTTDFEALYAYKCGEYQRCLQLSTHNVRTLVSVGSVGLSSVLAYPEFIQLMDDDIVSLSGLIMIVSPSCRDEGFTAEVTQLPLSLYLMTQCQMKLHHQVTSLAQTLDYIEDARRVTRRYLDGSFRSTLDFLLLKTTERKVLLHISSEPV